MQRDGQIETIAEVLGGEPVAVFAFAGADREPPYSSMMFFAEDPSLRIVFATAPGTVKGPYLEPGNGVCVQVDTRGVGLENMAKLARITFQGRLHREGSEEALASLHSLYLRKLPFAKVFLDREGVCTFVVEPERIVFARGFGEWFELTFPDSRPAR